jgi:hypothetical protein
LKKDPGLCEDFVKASVESWTYAFDNQEETIGIVERKAISENRPVNRSHVQWMLNCYRDLYIPKGKTAVSTTLSSGDYMTVAGILLKNRLIGTVAPYDSFYIPLKIK